MTPIRVQVISRGILRSALQYLLYAEKEVGLVDLEPDVVLLDSSGDWRETLARPADPGPRGPRPVLMTDHDLGVMADAMQRGVAVFVHPHDGVEALLEAIRAAAACRPFCSPRLLSSLIRAGARPARAHTDPDARVLSERELGVARLAAAGLCNEEIASRLGIGLETVKTHLQRCYRKLGLHNRFDLAACLHIVERRMTGRPARGSITARPRSRKQE